MVNRIISSIRFHVFYFGQKLVYLSHYLFQEKGGITKAIGDATLFLTCNGDTRVDEFGLATDDEIHEIERKVGTVYGVNEYRMQLHDCTYSDILERGMRDAIDALAPWPTTPNIAHHRNQWSLLYDLLWLKNTFGKFTAKGNHRWNCAHEYQKQFLMSRYKGRFKISLILNDFVNTKYPKVDIYFNTLVNIGIVDSVIKDDPYFQHKRPVLGQSLTQPEK